MTQHVLFPREIETHLPKDRNVQAALSNSLKLEVPQLPIRRSRDK